MTCLPQWKITALQAQLVVLRERYIALQLVITNAIASGNLSMIEFDSGEGKQKSSYRSLNELQKYEKELEQRIETLENRLQGKGLVNLNLRR